MQNNYKWGFIGCGNVTEVKSGPAYTMVNNFSIHAVMGRRINKAKDYAARHNVPHVYNNADALINNPNINAVYIATPPDTHAYYALKVAKAGKVCCIEKPMAPTYKACLQIQNAFNKQNIPLFVAYYRRSLPRFNTIKTWLFEQKIGEVRHITWLLNKPANSLDNSKTYNWRTDKNIAYGGYFDDLASHGIDLFIYLLGNITAANGIATNQQGLYTAMDAVTGNWLHKSGVTGSGSWNFGAQKKEDFVTIYGNKGHISFSVFNDQPITLETKTAKESLVINHPKHIQLHHVKNMRDALIDNKKHPSTSTTALHTSWVLEQILNTHTT